MEEKKTWHCPCGQNNLKTQDICIGCGTQYGKTVKTHLINKVASIDNIENRAESTADTLLQLTYILCFLALIGSMFMMFTGMIEQGLTTLITIVFLLLFTILTVRVVKVLTKISRNLDKNNEK